MPKLPKTAQCFGCGACVDICPNEAVRLIINKNGFINPIIDNKKCINCRLCEKKCPSLSFTSNQPNDINSIQLYAGWSINEKIRLSSSSGGIFTQVAYDFLQRKQKSAIVGAALINNIDVKHIIIKDVNDLYKIQGTKYKQSNLSGIYKECKDLLNEGYYILFSGTPCQIAAMSKFLDKNQFYDRIYFVELICHGVPSNLIIDLCLSTQHVKGVKTFRCKENGWLNSQKMTYIDFNNNEKKIKQGETDYFYNAFHNKMNLREICYHCPFSRLPRIGDLTIGDFWGNKQIHDYEKGVSIILVNNNRGSELLTNNLILQKVRWKDFLEFNSPIYTPFDSSFSFSPFLFFFKYLPDNIALKLLSTTYNKKLSDIFYYLWHKIFYKYRRKFYKRNLKKAKDIIKELENYEQK